MLTTFSNFEKISMVFATFNRSNIGHICNIFFDIIGHFVWNVFCEIWNIISRLITFEVNHFKKQLHCDKKNYILSFSTYPFDIYSFVEIEQWKHWKYLWNMSKVSNKDTRPTSINDVFPVWRLSGIFSHNFE